MVQLLGRRGHRIAGGNRVVGGDCIVHGDYVEI